MANKMNKRILVVDENISIRQDIWSLLEDEGYSISIVSDAEKALEKLNSKRFDMVMADSKMSGLEELGILRAAKRINPDIIVIITSANNTFASVVEAIRAGKVHYFRAPIEAEFVIRAISQVFEEQQVSQKSSLLLNNNVQKSIFAGIIAKSPKMRQIFELIERVSDTDSAVFITGETGVGKELVARAIHFTGARKNMPFVAINCGALTESLLESELFGHEKGAFTGAFKTKSGKFESAHKGTLFLDEIGDVSVAMQVKLLRALQEKKVERVGGTHPIDVDVRVISATNQNIKEKISSHQFRIDLFYRLNVIPIHVPPLRERAEDIPALLEHFLNRLNKNLNRNITEIRPRAIKQLMDYHWPGNVRELENVVEGTYITCDGPIIDRFTFPQYQETLLPVPTDDAAEVINTDIPFSAARSRVLKKFEKTYLIEALKRYQGNISQTAQKTGIHQRTLWRKLKEYGLDRASFMSKH